ncbi:GntR family transcriptional regulator [Ammoniphilus sp. 3BR4]|uniref:GntR family transcriptional regulator n=1 Tax=Ammoniphilus sp. 3BR4 TaxID=3158265 RepID=UPI00346564A9
MKKYSVVKEGIKKWILEEKYKPHEKIASENELADIFAVSRQTVRQAIGELVNEGWLYREQGRGTFCARRHDPEVAGRKSEKIIAVITTYISDYIFPSIIRGAESYLSEKGYSILLSSTNNSLESEMHCLQNILDRNIDGLIVEPTKSGGFNPNLNYYFTLENNKIPYVMINAYYSELNPISLTMDDETGGYLATEHLIRLGHKKIAGLFKTDDLQGINRMKGYVRAHREYHLPIEPEMILSYNTENKEFKLIQEAKQLMQGKGTPEKPTAFVCYNDEIALSLLDMARELGLHIPDDLSIVGYDDSTIATASELTTIQHPKARMGKDAAELILNMIESNKEQKIEPIIYQPTLIVRQSTAEAKSR